MRTVPRRHLHMCMRQVMALARVYPCLHFLAGLWFPVAHFRIIPHASSCSSGNLEEQRFANGGSSPIPEIRHRIRLQPWNPCADLFLGQKPNTKRAEDWRFQRVHEAIPFGLIRSLIPVICLDVNARKRPRAAFGELHTREVYYGKRRDDGNPHRTAYPADHRNRDRAGLLGILQHILFIELPLELEQLASRRKE